MDKMIQWQKSYYLRRMQEPEYRAKILEKQKLYNRSRKLKIISHYGGKCACCSESMLEFMSIDHINGDGAAHRRQHKNRGGAAFYDWLIRNKFPDGFQVLCHNCNMAKGVNGHVRIRIY